MIARRAGALTETIEHGVDGFLVDDLTEAKLALERVGDLDRAAIRRRALERFSPDRMASDYERVYRSVIEARRGVAHRSNGRSANGTSAAGNPSVESLPDLAARVGSRR